MVGDKLILKPYHLPPARDILEHIKEKNYVDKNPYFITIGGESGCGKSTLSIALKEVLSEKNINSFILHMDDYFHLPPTSNHIQRLDDINHVGPQEVDLDLLQTHLDQIRQGFNEIIKPLIHYKENDKRTEIFKPAMYDVFIIEGTYVSLLKDIDTKIFMKRTYTEPRGEWNERMGDPNSPIFENILEIEHSIIKNHVELADIIVDQDYNVVVV